MEPGLKQNGILPLPLSQIISQRGLIAALAATCGLAVILLACANPRYTDGSDGRSQGLAQVARTFSERGLTRLTADSSLRRDPVPTRKVTERSLAWKIGLIRQTP